MAGRCFGEATPTGEIVLLHNAGTALSVRAGGRSVCAGGDGAAQGAAMAVLVPGK